MDSIKHIVLYDGICNLCREIVNFIKKKDEKNFIHFIPLDSEAGKNLLSRFGMPYPDPDTVIYLRGSQCLKKSSAVLFILKDLGGIFTPIFALILIPAFIRDFFYSQIAKSRYSVSCSLQNRKIKHN